VAALAQTRHLTHAHSLVSAAPGTLTVMATSTDVLPVRSVAAGGLAALGIADWLATMSPHTARAYRSTSASSPRGSTTGNPTGSGHHWSHQLARRPGRRRLVRATRRRKLAAVLSFYRYAAAEGVTVTQPKTHQVPKLHRYDADTGALDTTQARRLWESTASRPCTRALVAVLLFCGLPISEALPASRRPRRPPRSLRAAGHWQRCQTAHRRPPRSRRRCDPRLAGPPRRPTRTVVPHPHRHRDGPSSGAPTHRPDR